MRFFKTSWQKMSASNKKAFKIATIFGLTLSAIMLGLFLYAGHTNISASMPLGLYKEIKAKPIILSDLPRGAIVTTCIQENHPLYKIVKERKYLPTGSEYKKCPGQMAPIMKQVYGLPSDWVDVRKEGVWINDVLLPNSKIREKDSKGRPIPAYLGRFQVANDEVFLLALYHDKSFDGRYMGPTKIRNIDYVLEPFLTWTVTEQKE
jgi:conjugative transfer signal peptidase TraF